MAKYDLAPATTAFDRGIDRYTLGLISDGQKLETVIAGSPDDFNRTLNNFRGDVTTFSASQRRGIERVIFHRLGQIITAQERGRDVLSVLGQSYFRE